MKIAKFLLSLLVLSMCLNFSACSGDDDKEEIDPIVGTWKFSSITADEVESSNADGKGKIEDFIKKRGESEFSRFTYIFTAENTVTLIDSSYPDEPSIGTYTFKDGKLSLVWGEGDYDVYYASLDNGVLYIYEDYLDVLNHLDMIDFIQLGINDFGIKFYKATVRMTFTKQ